MAADILTVCDALVLAVETALDNPADATVERLYLAPLDMAADSARHVWLFPATLARRPENRAENTLTYRVACVVAQRYTEPGEPTKAWVDSLVEFVAAKVYFPLDFIRDPLAFGPDSGRHLLTTSGEITVYDPERLQRGLFWSEITFEFQEIF